MYLFRILTENKNKAKVIEAAAGLFSGLTVYETIGFWQGEREKSLVIEILQTDEEQLIEVKAKHLCQHLKDTNGQDAVLLQKIACESWLI